VLERTPREEPEKKEVEKKSNCSKTLKTIQNIVAIVPAKTIYAQ
jgi:hypothetical protein